MPLNLYDDHKVSLRRLHGSCDLDIVRALYSPWKANVTEAYRLMGNCIFGEKSLKSLIMEHVLK